MSISDTFTKQQWQDQEALHRFQLISPLLQTGLDDARRLLSASIYIPTTLNVDTLRLTIKHRLNATIQCC